MTQTVQFNAGASAVPVAAQPMQAVIDRGVYQGPAVEGAASALPANAAHLSPSELIAFIQTALDDIDDRIRDKMDHINRARAEAKETSDAISALNGLPGDKKFNNDENAPASLEKLAQLREETDSPEVRTMLNKMLADYDRGVADPKVLDPETGQALEENTREELIGELNAELSEVEGKVQIDMIKLQSLMQERARLMTFVTNAMQALNEPLKTVVANYGRI